MSKMDKPIADGQEDNTWQKVDIRDSLFFPIPGKRPSVRPSQLCLATPE
jgi:hypothetical protein